MKVGTQPQINTDLTDKVGISSRQGRLIGKEIPNVLKAICVIGVICGGISFGVI